MQVLRRTAETHVAALGISSASLLAEAPRGGGAASHRRAWAPSPGSICAHLGCSRRSNPRWYAALSMSSIGRELPEARA